MAYYTQQKLWPALIGYCSLFLLTVIGTLYSHDFSNAFPDWECKLWFLGAPLFLFPMLRYMTKKEWVNLLVIFSLSTLMVTIGNIVWSTAILAQTGDTSQLFYTNASHFIGNITTHPSYLSMYVCCSWLICAELLRKKEIKVQWLKVLSLISLVLFPIEILFLQSKAGILVWGIVALLWSVVFLNYNKRRPLITIVSALVFVAIFGAVCLAPRESNRINESVKGLQEGNVENPSNGTLQRVVIWKTALKLSFENLPFGVGTGDVKSTLQEAYSSHGYTYMYNRQLNCHNQYLQTMLALGVLGIAALLLWLVYPLPLAFKQKNVLLIGFILIIALNMLVESMLETRAGSNFIPLLIMILWLEAMTKPCEEDLV